jgi:predicted GNAT superfamily acetyltransferase
MPATPPSHDDLVIRSIEPADLDRLLGLNEANVPEVGSVDAHRMEFIIAESPIALAAVAGGVVVGVCLVLAADSTYDSVNYRWFTQRYDRFMYLDRVAVDASERGRGVGRALYGEVDRRMAAIDHADHLALEVNVDPPNEVSLAFHARLGFSEVGQQNTPYGIRVSMQLRPTTRAARSREKVRE